MPIIGYARVSTHDQKHDLQIDALRAAGCDEIVTDTMSGKTKEGRKGLVDVLGRLQRGDTLVVWRLDRLARSLRDLVNLVHEFGERGIDFRSLQETIDTTTATGRLTFHVFAAMAQFERELINDRITAGRASAKARGVKFGRPRKGVAGKEDVWRTMREDGKSYREIGRLFSVAPKTVWNALNPKTLPTDIQPKNGDAVVEK